MLLNIYHGWKNAKRDGGKQYTAVSIGNRDHNLHLTTSHGVFAHPHALPNCSDESIIVIGEKTSKTKGGSGVAKERPRT